MKHTQGPWRAARKTSKTNNFGVYSSDGGLLASLDVYQLARHSVIVRRYGDACLMAAAPDLLFAAQEAKRELLYVLNCINKNEVPFDGDDFHEVMARCESAIAKATGESA
jgi:hypothetical protein